VTGSTLIRRVLVGVLLSIAWLAPGEAIAVPPPPEQVAADCDAPTYASDQLVCHDPELLELDRRMRSLLAQLDLEAVAAARRDVESQPSWFRRRSLCAFADAHAACLRAMYVDRISTLEALTPSDPPAGE